MSWFSDSSSEYGYHDALEPDEVFYNDLWNYRTITLDFILPQGERIKTASMYTLNTKLKRIFKSKFWYSKTYKTDMGVQVKPAYQMKASAFLAKGYQVMRKTPYILNYNPTLKELNENLIKNIGYYLVPSNLLVKNPLKYGVTKQQTDELFGLVKSDYTLVKHEGDGRIYNLINWRLTNPMEVKE